MKSFLKIFPLVIFLFSSLTFAQIQTSVSNILRYGNGERSLGNVNSDFIYRENLTDAIFRLPVNLNVGLRLLYDKPPEIGQVFKGISRRYIEYDNDDLYLRAGNLSELYGKGLAINLFENRGLAYDTWLDGINAKYKFDDLKVSVLGGTINFADSINFWREEEYTLIGGNAEYKFHKNFKAGISFVSSEGTIPLPGLIQKLKAEIPEIYLNLSLGDLDLFVDWSQKWTSVENSSSSKGSGIYSSLNFNKGSLGITLDYKNYKFDEQDPFTRYDFTRPTRMLPFQNPPIVQKEHSYLLLSRSIHQVDFNDEVGFQVEIYYLLNDETFFTLNGSLASRHNFYNYNTAAFSFTKEERSGNFLPSTEDKYSPFWEYLIEAEHSFDELTNLNIGFAQRSKIIYNDIIGSSASHKISSTVIPFFIQRSFSGNYSASIQYELEFVNDNYNTNQIKFTNQFISFINSFFSVLNINLRYEFTSNNYEVSGRKDWFTFETGYRINQNNNVSFSFGSERGGQTCSNGVCRYIQPFSGFKLTLLNNI